MEKHWREEGCAAGRVVISCVKTIIRRRPWVVRGKKIMKSWEEMKLYMSSRFPSFCKWMMSGFLGICTSLWLCWRFGGNILGCILFFFSLAPPPPSYFLIIAPSAITPSRGRPAHHSSGLSGNRKVMVRRPIKMEMRLAEVSGSPAVIAREWLPRGMAPTKLIPKTF